jgi:hypothetical protein
MVPFLRSRGVAAVVGIVLVVLVVTLGRGTERRWTGQVGECGNGVLNGEECDLGYLCPMD